MADKLSDREPRPFLSFATTPIRPLGAALPAIEQAEVTSPWLPRPATELATLAPAGPVGPTADELAQIIDDARAQGLAEGLAETAAMRAQLARLVAELGAARTAIVEPAAETIADAACCVVEAWLGHADRSALFLPVVRAWLANAGSPHALPAPASDPTAAKTSGAFALLTSGAPPAAIARVHPADVDALTQAITSADGGAPLAVVADRSLAPGAIVLRGPAFELSHSWHERLPELRAQILTALTGLDEAVDG
ncbi:MAG TPA: hypothetical protein VGC42_16065 [Kofleriaceae bacterium]